MTIAHQGRTAHNGLLRLALRIDAAASGALGLASASPAPVLDATAGIPTGWLVALGLFLLGYATGLAWLSARPRIPPRLAWTVVAGNLVWVVLSVAAVVLGWFPFTALGAALVVAQAAAVTGLAGLQYVGLRRGPTPDRLTR